MAPMSPNDALGLVKLYLPTWVTNRENVDRIDRWYRGKPDEIDKPFIPSGRVSKEFREMRDRSIGRWLKFVVDGVVRSLYVENYRPSDFEKNPDVTPTGWIAWQRNGLDARQIAVHRGAVAHGLSYVELIPGDVAPVIRGVSARAMVAFYEDLAADDWPIYALRGDKVMGRSSRYWRFRLYDAEARYTFHAKSEAVTDLEYIDHETHDAGECPIVRFAPELDLEGRAEGDVEPNIDLAGRIDQDTFDRMVVQRFGAWVVRYIAGMTEPTTDEEKAAQKLRLMVQDLLVAEDADTKFGTLQATPLDGYIKAKDADLRDLAVTTATPPADMLGNMVNLSAEALAAAEAGKTRKLQEREHTFGESWEQTLRMAGHLMGDESAAGDFGAQVVWRDMESRSLAQIADAFSKLVSGLGFPPEVLWSKIPGITLQDVNEAKAIRAAGGGVIEQLLRDISGGQTSQPAPMSTV